MKKAEPFEVIYKRAKKEGKPLYFTLETITKENGQKEIYYYDLFDEIKKQDKEKNA